MFNTLIWQITHIQFVYFHFQLFSNSSSIFVSLAKALQLLNVFSQLLSLICCKQSDRPSINHAALYIFMFGDFFSCQALLTFPT